MSKVAYCIFCRADSKRFPSKYSNAIIYNTPMLQYIIKSAAQYLSIDSIFILTGDDSSCDKISSLGKDNNISVLRGSEQFPVLRTSQVLPTLLERGFSHLCRICGDSPFYPFKNLQHIFFRATHMKNNFQQDLCIANTLPKTYPNGLSIEFYPLQCLNDSLSLHPSILYTDSLTEIISKQEMFIYMKYAGNLKIRNCNLTIDNQADISTCLNNYSLLSSAGFFADPLLSSEFHLINKSSSTIML